MIELSIEGLMWLPQLLLVAGLLLRSSLVTPATASPPWS